MTNTRTRGHVKAAAVAALSALLCATTGGTATQAEPAQGPTPAGPVTQCVPGGPLRAPNAAARDARGAGPADIAVCVSVIGAAMTVSAPAACACRTSGTWTARRADDGTPAGSGTLGGRGDYPGPGTYEITATVHLQSHGQTDKAPALDLRGMVSGTLVLTEPAPKPSHRIEVAPGAVRTGTTTTLTYTIARVSDGGDGSARFGLIGEADSGIELTSTDGRCVNPLTGRYPSTTRGMHALDCALTDLQPGRPATITVHATLPPGACSTIVSKLGYWTPRGQQVAGGMVNGPTTTCAA